MIKLDRSCPMCRDWNFIEASDDEFKKYIHGALLQDVFKRFNPLEREFVKTGYCPDCQGMLFGSNYKSKRIKPLYDEEVF